jgi:FkbM family methyltransferase
MTQKIVIVLAKIYAWVVWQSAKRFKIYLPGLGFAARRIKGDFVLQVDSVKYLFYPPAGGMYGIMLAGVWPEPETHIFLRGVVKSNKALAIGFLDIGAAIGEILIDISREPNIASAIACDPSPENCAAIRKSAELNSISGKVTIEQSVFSDVGGYVEFSTKRTGSSGSLAKSAGERTTRMPSRTIDSLRLDNQLQWIILIDTEGAELKIIQGAIDTVERLKPLIIFEYNFVSKRHFRLEQVQELLSGYTIYRLLEDGALDMNLAGPTWNCVAVPEGSACWTYSTQTLIA